ncbi:hypothetical protein LCGC14_1978250 [marine sediment metagenome]|uniref:Uncharacterized protein n=1 Tax=marine sediment metagenome TaxID=412755 RepID=A0A0F9I6N9_9ZZZZ
MIKDIWAMCVFTLLIMITTFLQIRVAVKEIKEYINKKLKKVKAK